MNAAPELIPSALKMIAALAAVLGGLFVIVHLARHYLRRTGGAARERLVRVLASQAIGVKKTVTLVEVPGCVLVLGVAAESIQLLSRIDDPELMDRIRAHPPTTGSAFSEHLSRLIAPMKAGGHEE
jgi:flagellar biogenesis protein FliO